MTRRNHAAGLATVLVPLTLAACGPADVTVYADLGDDENPEPLANVVVQVLPYDRDQVFDSLEQAAAMPQPEIPADLLAAQEEIAQAQQEWRDAETSWGVLRDTLQTINARLESLNRSSGEYRALFLDYEDLENEYTRAERSVGRLFENFTSLQQAAIGRMDSVRIVRADWADQAFEDVGLVIAAKIALSGLEPVTDTTGAEGYALFADGIAPGSYWVHARHELPYDELYWNIQLDVARGEPILLRLSRENAEVRPPF